MMRLLLLAAVVFCRRHKEQKFLEELQDLIDDLEVGIGDFEEQVGDLENFDAYKHDAVEMALADEGPDEFYEEIPTPEEFAVGDSSISKLMKVYPNENEWLSRLLDELDSSDDSESSDLYDSDSSEYSESEVGGSYDSDEWDSSDYWESAVGDSDDSESEDFDDLYSMPSPFGNYWDSSDEIAVGDPDEFYEEIPTPGEEYAVGDEYLDETVDEDEVPVDTMNDMSGEEEAVGNIYSGEDMDMFDDPEEVPVAGHGFDFLQEHDPYFESED